LHLIISVSNWPGGQFRFFSPTENSKAAKKRV